VTVATKRPSSTKRQRERARREHQEDKAKRRAARKAAKEAGLGAPGADGAAQSDDDIWGVAPGDPSSLEEPAEGSAEAGESEPAVDNAAEQEEES
jgi:hypothetical protein